MRDDKQPENAATVHVAKLDEKHGFIGVEEIASADAAGRFPVPKETDLPPDGSYRLVDGKFIHWKELNRPSRPPSPLEYVVAELAQAMRDAGMKLPPRAAEWLDWYGKSAQRRLAQSRHLDIPKA